eukprot:7292108-Prymnesium_polylepis.1
MDVTQVLLAAQSPDINVRTQAEQQILAAETSNMVRAARRRRCHSQPASAAPHRSVTRAVRVFAVRSRS